MSQRDHEKTLRPGGDPEVQPPAPRPAPLEGPRRQRQSGTEIGSQTVRSERRLLESLEQGAAECLGKEATEDNIRALAMRWYERRRQQEPPPETPVQRWDREEMEHQVREELRQRRTP